MAPDAFDEDDDARAALDEEEAASTPASVWLEESSRARAWANLLSPGLPRHRDALGDGLAPRPEVRARLRAHVSSLGPPHTLVLTGPEGSGKTTELAVLADWLRRGGREDPRVDDRFDDDAAPNSGAPSPASSARPPLSGRETGTREDTKTTATSRKGEPPFVLAHSFADASFPQDTAHFLEKACARLKRAFGIAERLPRDAADLPECFARFLERAALHRRVVVIVDACESARCAPCAGVGAAAVAGLDPRENAPSSFSTEERSALETTTSSRKETLDAALDAHLDAHLAASNAHLTDLRAHFKWLPQSPPLAVRFVLACREDEDDTDDHTASSVSGEAGENSGAPRLSVARAVVSGAPASRAVYPMPPMTVEQTRFVLASVSPTALADGARFRDTTRGAPNEASRVPRGAGSALERGHHHCFETAALVNAAAPHGATPLYARVAAPFVAGLCAATKHGAWVCAGGVGGGDEENEFSFVGADKRGGADESLEEKVSAVVVPPAVAAAVRASAGTAFGLVYGRLGAFERRADLEPRTLRAVCLALAVARFGVTEREARRVARRVVDNETRRKNVSRDADFSTKDTVDDTASSSPLASPFRDDAFDATMQALRPWLAPWTTRASWAAERAPFAGDEDVFENRKSKTGTEEASAADDDDVPLTFRDAPTRACVLRRYAPPHARSALDGASARRRLHADIAAFFLEEIQKHQKHGTSSSRRVTRAAAWHCAAAGDYAALASLIGGSPGAVAAFALPGLRSELATTLANGAGRAPPPTSSLLFAAVAENARAWLDAGDDEDDTDDHTDMSSNLERSKRTAWRSGRYAGASLALASLFCWLKAPKAALAALAAARERFGPPRGRSGVTCALALARCEALADLVRAEGFETSKEDFVDVDGRLTRLDSALPALAQQASSACETFAAASSGDFSGVFPFPWRETLVECSAFGSAMQSPPTLAALAATARVDVCVLGLGSVETSQTSQRLSDGSDVSSPDATSATFAKTNTLSIFDARLEEIRAWRRAALATATPRVSRALTTVLDRASPGSSFLAKHVSETAARGLSFAAEEEKRVRDERFRDERSERSDENLRASASTPSAEVFGLLGALRRRRDAFDPRAHPEDARDASDALVAVLSALLGEDHPETGAAKTVAAEAAARAAVDGGFHGFEERREEKNPSELLSSTDQYSSQIATIVAWSRPAYAFAERFYGARSLPAARAAWCVAEGARRGSASDSSRGGGASVKSSAPRPSAQSGRVSAGGAGARAARPMYAQALGATVATLGGAHGDTGATFVAAGALSRAERRAEEARALVEEGARVARKNAAAAETERDAIVAAGFGALENARRLCDAGASEDNHDLIEHVRLGVETSVAAAEARLRVAELRAGRSFATLALLTRDDAECHGDARSLTEAEALLRHALACQERADGPGCAASAPTLAALGRCATERRRAEEAEACFRHALGVDEAAARETLTALQTTKSETRSEQQQQCSFSLGTSSLSLGDFLHPRSASHLAAIAYSRLRVNGRTQAEALLHAALDAAAAAAAVPPAARAELTCNDDVADDPDDERASFARVDSDPGEILNRLGLMYSHQGRLEEAAQRFERAIALGAARMRAASRDAEAAADPPNGANGEETREKLAATPDETSAEADARNYATRARKMHRRASLVASADASRRWRDASALTSAALANLGVLRFKAADPSSRARGGSASFFHRAWTYAENNPELGPSHPHTAWARGWFDIAGGYDAAASDAGRASASMLDAVFEGEWGGFNVRSALATDARFRSLARDSKSDSKSIGIGTPAFRDGFETAWGVLAGETSAAVETSGVGAESAACEPCVVANDATPRKVPVLAELGSFSAGAAPTENKTDKTDKTIGTSYGYGSRDDRTVRATTHRTARHIRPSVSVALERFRPTERAISSWRLFWSDADAAHAARLDDLDVDLALASIVDDVANGAVGKHSEKVFSRDFVDVTTRDEAEARDEARKRSTAFAAAARRAARAAANASSFLFDDSVWARRCDGGDGRSLDATLGELGAGVGPYSTDPSDPSDPSDVRAKDDRKTTEFEDENDDDFHAGTSSDETLENIERRTDVPVDPADSALVARSFVVALDVETEAERAANPENEFLEHYRARLASRLMRTKEDAEWRAKKLDIQNASSRETMRRIVRDGDLVGFGEDDPNDPNDPNERRGLTVSRERLDGREIVSTRVSSIAGTRAAVDAAAAFFVDSSLEVGASFDTLLKRRKDDGRLEEPFLWAPGEAERAAARKAALEDAARDAAAARDETRRETLVARREILARDSLSRNGVTAPSGRSDGRDSLDSLDSLKADKNKRNKRNASNARTSEAARAAVEAASFAVRAAAEALAGGGDAAARADAVAAATRAARALARPNDGNGPPRERPSTASKLEAFKKRREDRTSSRPGTAAARTPPGAYERTAYFHEQTERTDDDLGGFARDSRGRESRRFVAADADDEPRIASPRSGYGSIPPGPSFSSHSPFVGVTRRRVASGNAGGESRDFHLGGARVSTRLDGSLRSDDVVSVPVSRLLSWVDRGLAVRGDAGTASADRLGGEGERASARAAEGEGAAAAAEEAVSPKKFRQRFAEDVTPRGVPRAGPFRESDDRRSAKLGAMLDEERAFRTHNASARLLADLSAARGARRLRESADATPRAAATRKSPARAPRPASAAAAAAAAEKPRRPTLASRRPSSAAGFAANAPDDERVWKARMRARVEERRRKLFGVG